jgi:hypothetical protein
VSPHEAQYNRLVKGYTVSYSLLSHLAQSIFFGTWEKEYIAVFTAYFDASQHDRVMNMSGFVSRTKKWERFEEAWKVLLPPNVNMFHMTDFASSQNGWEQWKGKSNSERRVKLVESLVSCIKSHTNQGFSGGIRFSHYEQINREYKFKEQFGRPYVFLGLGCLGRLKMWADKKGIDVAKVLCIFEEGDLGQGELIERARKDGINAIPQSKAGIMAFDACDLVALKSRVMLDDAWERELHLKDPDGAEKILRSMKQLETVVRGGELGMYSVESMRKICAKAKAPKR